jgi:hypothetical protein
LRRILIHNKDGFIIGSMRIYDDEPRGNVGWIAVAGVVLMVLIARGVFF